MSAVVLAAACGAPPERVLTISGSALGKERDVVSRQLERFQSRHPDVRVALRATPDAADQRHQLYVQWLNAHATEPDVLQLDGVWTAEFAAAGWIAPLDRFGPDTTGFIDAAVTANRWRDRLYALPWFLDVGMLYWRTDLAPRAPGSYEELTAMASAAQRAHPEVPFGFVWQGARYEGLVTVFVEYLGAFGGAILDADGRVTVDAPPAVAALTAMREQVTGGGITPAAVLSWQEEQARLAFQNGQAVFMRNWPYASALLADEASSPVAGRFAVAPMPTTAAGQPTGTLGGSQLAVNAYSDQPDEAFALIAFLLEPEQMVERATMAGQWPTREAVFDRPELAATLPIPPAVARDIARHATARPSTPVYSELSDLLQVSLHRALTGQQSPDAALTEAADAMRRLLAKVQLAPVGSS